MYLCKCDILLGNVFNIFVIEDLLKKYVDLMKPLHTISQRILCLVRFKPNLLLLDLF